MKQIIDRDVKIGGQLFDGRKIRLIDIILILRDTGAADVNEGLQLSQREAGFIPVSYTHLDIERVYSILDEMRDELPEEIRKAELVIREKQFILDDAKNQADSTIREAERQAAQLVDENEIVISAQKKAEEILTNAQRNAKEMKNSARSYANDVLSDIESYMGEYLELVRKNRSSLEVKARDYEAPAPDQRENREPRENREAREEREYREEGNERRGFLRSRRED